MCEYRCVLIVTLLAVMIPGGLVWGVDTDEYVTLLRDDFDTKDPNWDWWTSGTGTINLRDGYVYLNITDGSRCADTLEEMMGKWLDLNYATSGKE